MVEDFVNPTGLLTFVGIWLAAAAAPGGNSAFTVSISSRFGFGAGLMGVLGFATVLLFFFTLVAFGLDLLLSRFGFVLDTLRWLGAAYLLYLAYRLWQAPVAVEGDQAFPRLQKSRVYLQGALICLTNPKVMIFVAAIVPQTLDPQLPSGPQLVIFGCMAAVMSFLVHCIYALLGQALGKAVPTPVAKRLCNRLIAAIFAAGAIGLGISSLPQPTGKV